MNNYLNQIEVLGFENTDFIICVCGYANDPKFWNCKKCKRPLQ